MRLLTKTIDPRATAVDARRIRALVASRTDAVGPIAGRSPDEQSARASLKSSSLVMTPSIPASGRIRCRARSNICPPSSFRVRFRVR